MNFQQNMTIKEKIGLWATGKNLNPLKAKVREGGRGGGPSDGENKGSAGMEEIPGG